MDNDRQIPSKGATIAGNPLRYAPNAHQESDAVFCPLSLAARAAAAALDGAVVISTATIAWATAAFLFDCAPAQCLTQPIVLAAAALAVSAYLLAFWWLRMATPGMATMRAIIVDAQTGGDPTALQCLQRYLALLLSCATLGYGFVSVFKDPYRRAYHDRVSGTILVRQRENHVHFSKPPPWRFIALAALAGALVVPLIVVIGGGISADPGKNMSLLADEPEAMLSDEAFEARCMISEPQHTHSDQDLGREFAKARDTISESQGLRSALEVARASLDKLLKETPCEPQIYREYARYYTRLAQLDTDSVQTLEQAQRTIDRAIALSPSYAEAFVLKGFIEYLFGRNTQATHMLDVAQTIGTKDPWLHINRALIERAAGNLSGAAIQYRKVIDNPTPDRNAILAAMDGIAEYFVSAGDYDNANDVFAKRIEFEPDSALGHFKYARFLLCARDDTALSIDHAKKAEKLAKTATQFDPGTLLAANYARRWATYAQKGGLAAQRMAPKNLALAHTVGEGSPLEMIAAICPSGPAFNQVQAAAALPPPPPDSSTRTTNR